MRHLVAVAIVSACVGPLSAQDVKVGEKTVRQWSAALKSTDARLRYAAVAGLYEQGADAAPLVKELTPLLKDAQPVTRRAVAMTLANCKADAAPAVPALIAAMKDSDYWVRQLAWQALSEIGAPAAAPLLDLLSDKDATTRYYAILTIANLDLQSKDIAKALGKSVKDRNASVRQAALYALSKIESDDPNVLALLGEALSDKDQKVRLGAAQLLIGKGKDATDTLVKAADDPKAAARLLALQTIAAISAEEIDEKGILALRKGLADADAGVRQVAVLGLANFGAKSRELGGDKDLFDALTELLQEKDAKLRRAAVYALGQIGSDRLAEIKLVAGLMKDGDPLVRAFAIQALGKFDADNVDDDIRKLAQDQLLAALGDADRRVQFTAAQALFQENVRAVEPLTKLVEDGKGMQRLWAATILGELGSAAEDAVPALQKMSRDANPEMRAVALAALKKIQAEMK